MTIGPVDVDCVTVSVGFDATVAAPMAFVVTIPAGADRSKLLIVPIADGVLIVLSRMRRIIAIDFDNQDSVEHNIAVYPDADAGIAVAARLRSAPAAPRR